MAARVDSEEAARRIFEDYESKVQSYARSFPAIFNRAAGSELWDISGKRYLDFLAGAGSLNYGHNNPILKEALVSYIQQDSIAHSLDLHTVAKKRFLEALHDIVLAPRSLNYVVQFTGPTGANAVEAALKIARKVTGRPNIVFFTNAFHGVSLGALSVCGSQYFRCASGIPLHHAYPMPYDGYFGDNIDTLDYLERMLSDPSSGLDKPAAVIVEVVQGEGGLNAARADWLTRLQALCRERNILLVVDDIQAGCGRTGAFFSFEFAGLEPDVVVLSKSLSGYGLPFSVVLISPVLDDWKPGEHNGTFRGNNHAFVTATAMIEHYWCTPDFANFVVEKGRLVESRLRGLLDRFPDHLIDVRGRGMMQGVRCADPRRAAAITNRAFEKGLIIERCGPEDKVIKCMAPLTSNSSELEEGLSILEQAVEEEFGASRVCN